MRRKLLIITTVLFATFQFINISLFGQCTWHTILVDSFEYTTPCPDLIPGTVYANSPQTWTAHSGTHSLYMNFVNWTGTTGTDTGTIVYQRSISVCPNIPVNVSAWFTTTFSGAQCNMHIKILDANSAVLADAPSLSMPYSPLWSEYQSGSITPTTTVITFVLITNVAGTAGGNDLSMDDFSVSECTGLNLGSDTTICNTDSLVLDAGSGYDTYFWTNGSSAQTYTASTTLPGTSTSVYDITVTSGTCFFRDTIQVTFDVCTSVGNLNNGNGISVYPNPANDMIYFHSGNDINNAYFLLYDITGREMLNLKIERRDQAISLSGFNGGIYYYKITNGSGVVDVGKIIVLTER